MCIRDRVRVGHGPTVRPALGSPSVAAMALLRVATFNLLHGMAPASGATDPAELSDAVREIDADVMGLQEVDRCLLYTSRCV